MKNNKGEENTVKGKCMYYSDRFKRCAIGNCKMKHRVSDGSCKVNGLISDTLADRNVTNYNFHGVGMEG